MIRRLVLVGLSGSGKSTAAARVAEGLGWTTRDTDQEIGTRTGTTIPQLFRSRGESAFRDVERRVLLEQLEATETVIATGGGAVIQPEVWASHLLGNDETLTVWLQAEPGVLVERLRIQASQQGETATRPLLEGDALGRITAMARDRDSAYARADVALPAGMMAVDDLVDALIELVRLGIGQPSQVDLPGEGAISRITVGTGSTMQLASTVRARWPLAQHVWLCLDSGVAPHVKDRFEQMFADSPSNVRRLVIPSGEGSKSLGGLGRVYDTVLKGGLERSDVLVAVGGGVVGDLIGFAAATLLRGIGLVQVPTTLLAMVDSSVGGKTGINHDAGKNLVGSFYQPPAVIVDPLMLRTLPDREYRSGWAEIIKHAIIQASTPGGDGGTLLDVLELNRAALGRRDSPVLDWVIRQNVSIKASVVAADEREAGIRAFLNFGHTIGHAIEAAGYTLLHGEAIAVGMAAALRMSVAMGRIDTVREHRIRSLLLGFGLPLTAQVDPEQVILKMASDKKKRAGALAWVLPTAAGRMEVVRDVPDHRVREAIQVAVSTDQRITECCRA